MYHEFTGLGRVTGDGLGRGETPARSRDEER